MANASVANGSARKAPRVRVKYRKPNKLNTKYPHHRLPFRGREGSYWEMPPVDGYGTGCDMGTAAALAYLKAHRAGGPFLGGMLQHVVLSILEARVDPTDPGQKGIIVGFFSNLDRWLYESAKMFGGSLDGITEADIEQRMTRAANETKADFTARLEASLRVLEAREVHS